MADTVAFFAHERGDARVRKRIASLQAQGLEIDGYTFHRERDKQDPEPTWRNIHLGTTYNRRYLQRLWVFATCLGVLWKHRADIARAKALYVINTDNAVLAMLACLFAGVRVPLALELADIQPLMTGEGPLSKAARWLERQVLSRCALLVTTSPGFVKHYFEPVQDYTGRLFLLENKVYPSAGLPAAVASGGEPVANGCPWIIGCFGAFRCRRSLQIMRALAEKLGENTVRFVLRGYPAGTLADEFESLIGDLPNLKAGGAYQYPGDLAEMYGGVDFNWAIDETDPNGNSAWLLPNRIYEGGCFGVPLITAAGTETGAWATDRQLGWAFTEPLEESLATFFSSVTPAEWSTIKQRCENAPRVEFTGEADVAALAEILKSLS